ncbi:tyrosine-type recombinase/integrase [Streptomyces polyrhachis]|uniref:Tyrosine-type recombinase/integrase n=1 Tax=Streptomyces polyrhachis TaxID=1282885 RepID=A0ABW2GH27_9ACTN
MGLSLVKLLVRGGFQASVRWGGWDSNPRPADYENSEGLHPDWVSRRFRRLVELSGLPPVRLHDLRHISATLSLLAKNDIKVVQERLGHSSRQITSDTYTSVLPEMMRAEAESVIAVVPRGITYETTTALSVPEDAHHHDVIALYVRAVREAAEPSWTINAATIRDGRPCGTITVTGGARERATEAAAQWLRTHCTARYLDLFRTDDLTPHVPKDEQQTTVLLRFLAGRQPTTPAPRPSGKRQARKRPAPG